MVTINIPLRRFSAVQVKHKWFAVEPGFRDLFGLVFHYHCKATDDRAGFKRQAKYTILVDLQPTDEQILDSFHKNTKYKVRRAINEETVFQIEESADHFADFYDEFSLAKGRERMDRGLLNAYWKQVVVTKAVFGGEDIAMHSYLRDRKAKRALMLHSASSFRQANDSGRRNLIGRANRFLHYQDMLYFKQKGFVNYDFGGYAKGTQDAELININEFKDGFGGRVVEESNYISLLFYYFRKLRGSSGMMD